MALDRLAELVLDPGLPPLVVYGILFLGCVLESFFPPWPADVITLYTGFLAGRGILAPVPVAAVAIAGTQVGVMGAFWASRRFGRALVRSRLARYLPTGELWRLKQWFARYGLSTIVFSRFFPGVRALVPPAAALAGVPAWKVWVLAGTSVVVWNLFVVGIGFFTGTHLAWGQAVLLQYNLGAVIVLGLLIALAGVVYVRRRRAMR